jgi:exopolyphosphatase/guanosine-5'-triphosphate,3'-diphosphate pyrophosphatase
VGAIRLLKRAVARAEWRAMKSWVSDVAELTEGLVGIGTGGNITKLYSLSGKKEGKPISYQRLRSVARRLKASSYRERMRRFDLRPDRADVIVPAADIYLSVMKWGGIEKMIVPQVGLCDGLVRLLYQRRRRS